MAIFTEIWLIMQWILFGLMIVPVPIFFYLQYRKEKANGNKGGMAFNMGYVLFFIFTSLNQLVYIIDATEIYKEILGLGPILDAGVDHDLIYPFTLKSQIILMLFYFFCSFMPIMYPVEKYIQKWKKYPVSKILLIGTLFSGIIWLLFCYFRIPQPLESIPYQVVLLVLILISFLGLLTAIVLFYYFYMKLAFSSTGIVRKKAIIVSFGIFFMYFALIIGNLSRPDVMGTIFELIGPITLIFGILILVYGFKLKGT